jgi:hypothetical protein
MEKWCSSRAYNVGTKECNKEMNREKKKTAKTVGAFRVNAK